MHDIKTIRADGPAFDAALARRGVAAVSAALIGITHNVNLAKTRYEAGVARKRELGQRIGELNKQILTVRRADEGKHVLSEKRAAQAECNDLNFALGQLMEDATREKTELELLHGEPEQLKAQLIESLAALPNLPAPEVPNGLDETGNVLVHERGTKPAFAFAAKEHDALALRLGYDPDAAGAIAGARFAVLKGPLARLHRALGQWMLDTQVAAGYTEVIPPLLVRQEAVFGVGQLPKFEEDLFKTTDGRYLISTSEVSLTNLVREKILDADDLPLRFTALTPCFRSEAGSAGRDTKGLIRQHQFEKVEMVSIVRDQAAATLEHERMTACAEAILDALGLAYRRMLLCAGDMGFAARKTYDLEVWLPGQGQYREISSCTDCGDFQARRMDARWKTRGEKGTKFVHTLNGSGLAVGRTLVAVLENYQEADGSVRVPDVLRSYMGGVERLVPGG